LTEQYTLEKLCEIKLSEFMVSSEGEEDDHGGDDDDDYDYNTVITRKSPSPDTLPKDEDEFWENYCREDDELYGEDWKSPSPDTLPNDEDEYWENKCREDDDLYGEDRESPSP
jgi:hypothetical protein